MKKLLLAFCVLFSVCANAQTWTNYFPYSNEILCSLSDKKGNMWFGTGIGVLHFDGNTWKTYTSDDGLSDNHVFDIAIDSKGNKWFATVGGVSKFDDKIWTTYTKKDGLLESITTITIDNEDKLWLGANLGVSIFDGTVVKNYYYASYSGLSGPGGGVRDITIDNQNNKWFATYSGVSKFDDTTWTNYTTLDGLANNDVRSIAADSLGNIWLGTDGGGISKFDGKNWTTYRTINGIDINRISSVALDSNKDIFFGTYGFGVLKFDGKNWSTISTANGIASIDVSSIAIDNESNKWFGTYNGITKFKDTVLYNHYNYDGLVNNSVGTLKIDQNGNKWFGTSNGVSKFDGETWVNYTTANSFPINSVHSIAIDTLESTWFATSDGVLKFDGKNWTKYTTSDGLSNDIVNVIAIDAQENKWFGTSNGVSKFDGKNWVNYFALDGLVNNYVTSIIFDMIGNVWFGTSNGISKFDGKNWMNYTAADGLKSTVWCMAIDAQGNIWLGTYNGVSKFDGENWTSYTTKNGLINNSVYSIVIDANENKWFGTEGGVSRFDGKIWTNYIKPNSLNGNNVRCIGIDTEGDKWFGFNNSWQEINGAVSMLKDGGVGPLILNKVQKGILFNDLNSNGKKDPNETNISGQIVKVDNNYTTTQSNGIFYTSLNNGIHTFTYRPQANWQLTTDSTITVIVSDAPIKDTLYFGVQAIANNHELEAKLTGTATRSGFESKSWINYTNLGTLAENGTVSYTIAAEASLVQSIPVADSTIGKRLVWKYSNLIPNEQRQISITTQMPGVNYLGDTLVSITKIKSAFAENSDTLKQVLTGSYDPNDKLVAQGIGSKGYVLFGKELEYTVRFQNTGTDTAFNVNIRDTLDLNLDVASLQIVASSHPVKLDLRGQNEATFRFENIKLPHQKRDTLGSNGFVKYTIRPKKNLAENTPVKNKAYIYFDFNPAIITNQTLNTYVSFLPSPTGIDNFGFQSNKSASIFPNPAKDEFTIIFPQSGTYEISLSNIQGKSIKTWNEIVGQETTLSVEDVEPGMYLYTAQGRNGQKYIGKLVIGR